MPLLLLPLVVLGLVALWLVLLPVALWARYRAGRVRRRAPDWIVRLNAGLLAASLPLFLLVAWTTSHWVADALQDGAVGLLLGVLLGIIGLWLTRFEPDARGGLAYTPHRLPALLLTTLVALRILAGAWMTVRRVAGHAQEAWMTWLEAGAWMGVAGLFLGYALAYAWGLRARLMRVQKR
jgi:hypothetical protein